MEKSNRHIRDYIQLSGELFEAVQKQRVYPDSKHFVDMVPKSESSNIIKKWQSEKDAPDFNLKRFIETHFYLPENDTEQTEIQPQSSCRKHIQNLWPLLFRKSDSAKNSESSLLPLPKPYVVPGGRFREIYYWDSYFTAQGLMADGHHEMVLSMTENFRHLIETVGHIPNGNRAYYLSRSQPPFFAPMVDLVISHYGEEKVAEFLPAVEKEYQFWMNRTGADGRRSLSISDDKDNNFKLNRYWDDYPAPRQESWFEDVELAEKIDENDREQFYRNIRAACESGWDFSSRWFSDQKNLSTIETTNILPVDLNVLLWFMEKKCSEWNKIIGNSDQAKMFDEGANDRKHAINQLMWDSSKGFFFDYNHAQKKQTNVWSLAAVYPLYFGVADSGQASAVAKMLEEKFLKDGGLVTTTNHTGEQWDFPNGWAPLQWMAVKGLERYGFRKPANTIKSRWLELNNRVFQNTGKMVEKYNVADLTKEGGGGEYPLQDGFGWSNGVYSAFDE